MKSKLLALIACIALLGPAEAASITYNVDLMSGDDLIQGTITTDGTASAPLTASNITAWNVTIENNEFLTYVLNNNTALETDHLTDTVTVVGNDLTASATQLLFNYSDSSVNSQFGIFASVDTFFNLLDAFEVSPSGQIDVGYGFEAYGDAPTGNVIGTTNAAATPLPGALPLFGAGLAVMGLLGWRRKRKAAAIVAA